MGPSLNWATSIPLTTGGEPAGPSRQNNRPMSCLRTGGATPRISIGRERRLEALQLRRWLALLEALVCFEEDCVLRTEVLNRDHSALAVPLAEYLGEIPQHETCLLSVTEVSFIFGTESLF